MISLYSLLMIIIGILAVAFVLGLGVTVGLEIDEMRKDDHDSICNCKRDGTFFF